LESVLDTAKARAQSQTHNPDYVGLEVPGANHFFDGHEAELVQAVADWLDARGQ
jgi:alpha/beta superfamily hydrolase